MTRLRYAVVLAVLAAAAGCGSHGASGTAPSKANAQDASVKFAQCMRDHGVKMADPKPGEPGIRITGGPRDETQMNAAMRACRKYDPHGNIDPNDPKVRDQMLKTARCLRAHGVQIADPQPGQGLKVKVRRGDQKLQAAMEACRKLVPPPSGAPSPRTDG